ncbi:FecR family protein [Pedobacter panaciterrae]|uniref:FecR family protein n=1 Tax=Pedobacter panaciterrae TaxID=363849 RepID=UPI00155DCE53|nr:FecR family protein [Pedobacter panaciterrae]NQX56632.1 FecR family protein [Pedobacter panaciterrae]
MTDQRFTELLGKRLAGEISPKELIELKELLSKSTVHRNEYENLTGYFNDEKSGANNIDAVFEKIKQQITIPEPKPIQNIEKPIKRNFVSWYRIAAVIAFCTCSFAAYHFFIPDNPAGKNDTTEWKVLQTPSRDKSKIILEDGTEINLNAKSQLKYPASFSGKTREVYLNGEAFFDVKKDPDHPFIIHTKHMRIKVLGTAFDVKVYEDDSFIETTLVRGLIQVTLNNKPAEKIILKPNQKFTIADKNSVNYTITPLTYYNSMDSSNNNIMETSWLNDRLAFKNQTFVSIARDAERKYGVEIRFNDEKKKDYTFTGKFEKESIDELLNALSYIEDFSYKKDGNIIYIY